MAGTIFIVIFTVFIVWVAFGVPMPTLPVGLRGKAKAIAKEAPASMASKNIVVLYERLPEEHRPTYDLRAALRALDTKYGIFEVDSHFVDNANYYSYTAFFTFDCHCVWDGHNHERLGEECSVFPEYRRLYDGIVEINDSLREREQEIKRREHEMVLAGIEGDLRSVDEITKALRNEKDLIDNVTKEICS